MEETKIGLARWLEEQCREEHLSLREAGKKAGLSHSAIHDIMKGGHPSAKSLIKLATAFSNNNHHKRGALEDELFILAGYRSEHAHVSGPVAELMDIVSGFSKSQLSVVRAFATYLAEVNKHGK